MVLIRPDTSVIYLGFGWISQQQVMTYSSGIPLFIIGLLGGVLSIRKGLRTLLSDRSFLCFVVVSAFFSFLTIIMNPIWRNAAFTRLLSITAAIAVYSTCSRLEAREFFRIASISCGVIIAANAIIAAHIYGQTIVHIGNLNEFQLSDSNYASLPIIFGISLALQYLGRGRLWRWDKVACSLSVVIMSWGILLSASRGAQLSTAVILVLWLTGFLFAPRTHFGTFKRMGVIAVVSISVFFMIGDIKSGIFKSNLSRWEEAIPSGGSNRVEIYTAALNEIKSKPLNVVIGGGIGHNLEVLGGRNAHNQILDSLFDYGILGVICLIWFWIRLVSLRPLGIRGLNYHRESTTIAAVGLGVAALLLSPIWYTLFWIEIAYLAACTAPEVNNHKREAKKY